MATSRLSPERKALVAKAELIYVHGRNVGGAQEWPSYSQLADELGLPSKLLEEQGRRHDWVARRQVMKDRMLSAAHEKTRHEWAKMNASVIEVSHRTALRIERLINDKLTEFERMIQKAKNLELLERAAGNDDAVVPTGVKASEVEALARAADNTERHHARIMARAGALPLLHPPAEGPELEELEQEETDKRARPASMAEIYETVVRSEVQAAIRNGVELDVQPADSGA